MNWERVSNTIGISLIALCFAVSLGRIITLRKEERPGEEGRTINLRIAYYQLEGGVREAMEAIGKKYTDLHPNAHITLMPIPERIFKNWRITQLVGQTPPDLIQLGSGLGEEQLARYFEPLGEAVDRPNPYNKGTPLENTAMRETFFEAMQSGAGAGQIEYYGVSASVGTIRMFYNMALLKEITGSTEIPKTYRDFIRLCEQTRNFSEKTGRKIVPVGGAGYNASILLDYLFSGQTQRLLQSAINKPGQLSPRAPANRVADTYWKNEWSLHSPEVVSGIELMGDVAKEIQPGFAQLQRDDAIFYFSQGSAVMIPSGTWDAVSLETFCPFPIATGQLPLPDPSDPVYGKNTYGPVSEADQGAAFTLAVPRDAKNPEVAKDFLLFMGSMGASKIWTDTSDWPPAIAGVEPSPKASEFTPKDSGYPAGFPINNLGADSRRVVLNNFHLLIGPGGSTEAFLTAIEPEFAGALETDIRRSVRTTRDLLRRTDSLAASLSLRATDNSPEARKLDLLIQMNTATERGIYESINALRNKP